jgi:hypothetical protein
MECKKCGNKIQFLLAFNPTFNIDRATLTDEGALDFDPEDIEEIKGIPYLFRCPECNTILAEGDTAAVEILKGA